MDYYKFFSTKDEENAFHCGVNKELFLSKNLLQLDQILKKLLDYEPNVIDHHDIDYLIDKFSNITRNEFRSPVYFTLGYLATKNDWSVIWKVQDWLSKWLGVDLKAFHTIRYYRYLQK